MNLRDCDVFCPRCGHKMVVLRDGALCFCPKTGAAQDSLGARHALVNIREKLVPTPGNRED